MSITLAVIGFQAMIAITMWVASRLSVRALNVVTGLWVLWTIGGAVHTYGLGFLQLITIAWTYGTVSEHAENLTSRPRAPSTKPPPAAPVASIPATPPRQSATPGHHPPSETSGFSPIHVLGVLLLVVGLGFRLTSCSSTGPVAPAAPAPTVAPPPAPSPPPPSHSTAPAPVAVPPAPIQPQRIQREPRRQIPYGQNRPGMKPCEFKGVMTDADYLACGIRPPNPDTSR